MHFHTCICMLCFIELYGPRTTKEIAKTRRRFFAIELSLNDCIVAKATSILGQFLNREDAKLTKVQIDTITSVMDGKNTFVVGGVGSGKSFMYLIPAIIMLQQHQRLDYKLKTKHLLLFSPLLFRLFLIK